MSPDEQDFHKEEFKALKAEVAELLKAAAGQFQYAVIGSGAIFTWLMTTHKADEVALLDIKGLATLVIWLPLVLSGLLFSLSLAAYIRIGEMGRYLAVLENDLGHPQRGWEKAFRRHPATIGPIFFWGWLVLIAGDWAAAIIFTK
jgi:hypothetical protein